MVRIGRLLRISEEQLYGLRHQFTNNAAKAVFLGRFVALLRIFAGPLAGISEMPYGKFFLCNASGAAVWASVMVSLSFFVGRLVPLEKLVSGVATFSVGALLLLVLAIAVPRLLELRNPLKMEEK